MDSWIKLVLTLIVLLVALFLIVFVPQDQEARNWAFGTVGILLGYWLKPGPDAAIVKKARR